MTDDRQEMIAQCCRSLERVAGLMKAQDSEWLSLDLGMGQLKAMMMLVNDEPLTVGGLARALNLSEPAASLLVDKLVQRGLARRETDGSDRRRTLVLATPDGATLIERLRRTRRELWIGRVERMAEPDLQAFIHGLDAFAAVILEEGDEG